ncbi:hypothetical protein CCYA_CCYA12G3423 [Cyanidiococcus yangmingshanensis]|nr:hypothetical protein CCYA_CCYA12G3423 [Cyanidiococcus yangmingshanensis]
MERSPYQTTGQRWRLRCQRLDRHLSELVNRHARWVYVLEEGLHLVAVFGTPGSEVEWRAEAVSVLIGALEWYRQRQRVPPGNLQPDEDFNTACSISLAGAAASILKLIQSTELLGEMLSQRRTSAADDIVHERSNSTHIEATVEEAATDPAALTRSHWFYSWLGARTLQPAAPRFASQEDNQRNAVWSARPPYYVALVLETLKAILRMTLQSQPVELSRTADAHRCAQNECSQVRRMLVDWDRNGAQQLGLVIRRGRRTKRSFLTLLRKPPHDSSGATTGSRASGIVDHLHSQDGQRQETDALVNRAASNAGHGRELTPLSIEDLFMFVVDRRGLVMAERLWSATERYLWQLIQQKDEPVRFADEESARHSDISGDLLRQHVAIWIRIWRPVIYLLLVPRVKPWSSWLVSFMLDFVSSRWLASPLGNQTDARGSRAVVRADAIPPAPLLLYMLREPVFSSFFVRKLVLPWSRRGRAGRFVASLVLGLAQAATKYYFLTAAS